MILSQVRSLSKFLNTAGGRLRERAIRSGAWIVLGDGLDRIATLVKLAIIGRLLSPDDFGLMGMALIFFRSLEYFTQTGFNTALIQRKGQIEPYLDTAWMVQLIRHLCLAALIFFGAPLVGQFFANDAATAVTRAIAGVALLRGFDNPAVVLFRKELHYREDVLWRLSGTAGGLLAAIPSAFILRNVWALVISLLVAQLTQTLSSYWFKRYRPRFRMNWAQARELATFGKWILFDNVLTYLGLYIDSIVIGKLLGSTALGLYQMAHRIAALPTQVGTRFRGLALPTFSKLRDGGDPRSWRRYSYRWAAFSLDSPTRWLNWRSEASGSR